MALTDSSTKDSQQSGWSGSLTNIMSSLQNGVTAINNATLDIKAIFPSSS